MGDGQAEAPAQADQQLSLENTGCQPGRQAPSCVAGRHLAPQPLSHMSAILQASGAAPPAPPGRLEAVKDKSAEF